MAMTCLGFPFVLIAAKKLDRKGRVAMLALVGKRLQVFRMRTTLMVCRAAPLKDLIWEHCIPMLG